MGDTRRRCQDWVDSLSWPSEGADGATVAWASADGDSWAVAAGMDALGRSYGEVSLLPLYCLIKPIVGLCALQAIKRDELSLDDRCGDLIDLPSAISSVTVEDLLAHRSALADPPGLAAMVMPKAERANLLAALQRNESAGVKFSELSAWVLLEAVLVEALGASLADQIHELCAGTDVRFGESLSKQVRSRIRLNRWVDIVTEERTPVLWELSQQVASDGSPGSSGYATARGLAQLFARAARLIWSARKLVTAETHPWSLGLMDNVMKAMRLEGDGSRYVGHFGFKASSVLLVDLEREEAIFVHLNSLGSSTGRSRHRLGGAVSLLR